ncbi:MAG: hypothetical protein WCD79_20410 [Chthoniobacteraceae bacterium]
MSHILRGEDERFQLKWDLDRDFVVVSARAGGQVWAGSLLPSLVVADAEGKRKGVPARLMSFQENGAGAWRLGLSWEGVTEGELCCRIEAPVLEFTSLELRWGGDPVPLVALYYGAKPLTVEESRAAVSLEEPLWPDWRAEGCCIPSAKGAPVQSFFRKWDFGHASIPLGNFGPSMGTPYAAAYPRPLFAGAMGGAAEFVTLGAGSIPDGAMTWRIRSSCAMIELLFREDLWGAPAGAVRRWEQPFRLAWAESAWESYRRFFGALEMPETEVSVHQKSVWNSWGDFRLGRYDIPGIARRAHDDFGVQRLVLDDGWETWSSSGYVHPRFPNFAEDIAGIKKMGLEVGAWQTLGWIKNPEETGLGDEDFICGADGAPRRVSWNMDPRSTDAMYYFPDPSSEKTRSFLRERTHRVMRLLEPTILKLDFGYNTPPPDVGAPRDPALRGERCATELMKIVADAAREINPQVTIQYYGISPLLKPFIDMIALDDLGDCGEMEGAGHGEWSIWAALAGLQGTAIMASSGYDWHQDEFVILDTAIIGSSGSILPSTMPDGSPVPDRYICRRLAIARWQRHTRGWAPLWLNTEKGTLARPPRVRNWGRLEKWNGETRLVSLILQQGGVVDLDEGREVKWSGRWAIISQDERSIFETGRLALIPFEAGAIEIPYVVEPREVRIVAREGETMLKTWRWENGRLGIELPELGEGFIGVVVVGDLGRSIKAEG